MPLVEQMRSGATYEGGTVSSLMAHFSGNRSLEEGTPAEIGEAKRTRMRSLRVEAARARYQWKEYDRADLGSHGRYLGNQAGDLLELVTAPVFVDGGGALQIVNEIGIVGWFLDPTGEPVFLKTPTGVRTVREYEEREAAKARKRQEAERTAATKAQKAQTDTSELR